MTERDPDPDVEALIEATTPAVRQRDARTLLEIYRRVTGQPAQRRGTIIGFGSYRYRYESGHSGEAAAAGFAPRKAATSIYLLDGIDRHAQALAKLGSHRSGVGCLYLTNLDKIDLAVLERVIADCYAALTSDTWPWRAGRSEAAD
ncbi:DUF1801 domain-containing protein [Aestuariimicrobium ganziense]|uniref:DUF1801 domain-containing protein n=1 Tax=Aestuariimicrobium ganziense TaxID=2773677 RepID=UPI0019403FBF|nr:DUF1801 domain-containing protein [Aestuariimicrobium ganziense]